MKIISGLSRVINWSGSWKWWLGGLVVFLALIGLVLFQHQQIQTQRSALVVASEQLRVAASQLRAKDNLLSTLVKSEGVQWTTAEEKCLAQVQMSYDAGRSQCPVDGVQRSIRERQAAGAFRGSVPVEGSSGGSR